MEKEKDKVRVCFELHFKTAGGDIAWRWGKRLFPFGVCNRWKKFFIIESLRSPWMRRNTALVKLQYDEPELFWQGVFIGEEV